jgi:ribosomal-protein-alanine N-acetyltransferase
VPALRASHVRIERPSPRRRREYLDACHRSRALHRGLVVTATTPAEYRDYLERAARANQESFFVVAAGSGELAGVVDILDIVRDAAPVGRLGYYAFVPHAGTGLMYEGVGRVVDLAFGDLGLVRLEAHIQPDNRRSRELAERLGLRREGRNGSLKVGSRWRDHERWTLQRDAWTVASHDLLVRA